MAAVNLLNVVREIFDRAVALGAAERGAFVVEACGGDERLRAAVEELLSAHDRAGEFLGSPEMAEKVAEGLTIGKKIGRYTLLKKLGEGGYGTVYLAEQDAPLRRRVALKVIKAGMDTKQTLARFELERQALAMMNHEHIARVLDAGATEKGRPYFVMEYVDGVALTAFAREQRLSITQRLRLFLDVCSAVRHAHQKGIIHRDIKPANVLVMTQDGKAIPKVIDFGIAKAIDTGGMDFQATLTQSPQFLGTPQYMSPEQAGSPGGDIDSRTDVYSLGVLLYELLTGLPPFDPRQLRAVGVAEIQRILREVDPVLPSEALSGLSRTLLAGSPVHANEVRKLADQLRGDLDWITMKAMEKDRNRRYETVETLAADLERYLRDEPVGAGPPRPGYRMRKFFRRHRRSVVLLLIAAISMGLGVGGAMWMRSNGADSFYGPPAAFPISKPLHAGIPGQVYAGSQFEKLVGERTDSQIDFFWAKGEGPLPDAPAPHYSIRWNGVLRIPAGGTEEMGIQVDDGGRIIIDGVVLMQPHKPGIHMMVSILAPGDHELQVDYWNRIAEGRVMLRWKLRGKEEEIVPPTAFFHADPILDTQAGTQK